MVTVLTSALELFDRINVYGQIVHERTQYLTGATARVVCLIYPPGTPEKSEHHKQVKF